MANTSTTPTAPDNGEHLWLVRTGPPNKLRWRECEPELAAKLENAYLTGQTVFTHEWDGWVYQYDMNSLTQKSPGALKTERPLRRVQCSTALSSCARN